MNPEEIIKKLAERIGDLEANAIILQMQVETLTKQLQEKEKEKEKDGEE